jgi:hypothetical protein
MGSRDYDCTPWAMPSYGVFGWQRPCYLLQEGYTKSYGELLGDTKWEQYGHASGNPACRDCMVHSGFEASAVADAFSSLRGLGAMARAFFFGPRLPSAVPARVAAREEASQQGQGLPVAAPTVSQGDALDATPESLVAAFHYRGDVTLELTDGSRLDGFVSNVGDADLELWPRRSVDVRRIPRAAVRRVTFTGRDRAAAGQDRLEARASA